MTDPATHPQAVSPAEEAPSEQDSRGRAGAAQAQAEVRVQAERPDRGDTAPDAPEHEPRGLSPIVRKPVPGTTTAVGLPRSPIRFIFRASGIEPALRLGALALKLTLRHGLGGALDRLSPSAAPARHRARLERSANDTVRVLGALKGAFAKAGQFAATRPDLVPAEVHAAFESLRDRVPPLPFGQVRAVIEAELGRPIADCFARIGHVAIGSASIAQVHWARLHDGTQVAVKVQYPWLRASLGADTKLIRLFLMPVLRARGVDPASARRLFDEFAAGLADELDFEAEARNAQRIAANLADDSAIVVPRVHSAFSRTRVLTLDHVEGVPLARASDLEAAGIEPRSVVEILTRAYARQIFVDGLFHADPHPGNLLAQPGRAPGDGPRVVFLDFGLSRQLSPELRTSIRQAIFAVLKRDPAAFVDHMNALDMIAPGAEPGVRAAVDAMFERMGTGVLQQSGREVLGLKDEAKSLLRDTPGLQLPNDLLLYAKTLSYLFHLGEVLAPDVDLMKLAVPHLLRFLAERD